MGLDDGVDMSMSMGKERHDTQPLFVFVTVILHVFLPFRVLGRWLVSNIAKNLDVCKLMKEEALLSKRVNGLQQTSEYNVQLQCAMIAEACYDKIIDLIGKLLLFP